MIDTSDWLLVAATPILPEALGHYAASNWLLALVLTIVAAVTFGKADRIDGDMSSALAVAAVLMVVAALGYNFIVAALIGLPALVVLGIMRRRMEKMALAGDVSRTNEPAS